MTEGAIKDDGVQDNARVNAGGGSFSYVVQRYDTLRGIARSVYGDETLWYVIAEANALPGNVTPPAGSVIDIPAITRSSNTANTFKVFNPAEAIGEVSPSQVTPPPPPAQNKGCGTVGLIIIIVVAVVVSIATGFAATAALASTLGSTGAGIAGLAIGAAAGSIASQAVGMAIGAQENFSWMAVGRAALAAAVTAGVGGGGELSSWSDYAYLAANAAATNVATQVVLVSTGLQDKFQWKSVMVSALSAPVSAAVGTQVGQWASTLNLDPDVGGFAAQFAGNFSGGVVRAAAYDHGRFDLETIAADAFGNALGNSFGGSIKASLRDKELIRAGEREAKVMASTRSAMDAAGIVYEVNGNGDLETASPYTKDAVERLVRNGHAPENIAEVLNDPAMRRQVLERVEVLPDGGLARHHESGAVSFSVRSPEIEELPLTYLLGSISNELAPLPRSAGVQAIETLLSPVISAGTALAQYQAQHPDQMQLLSIAAEGVQLAVGGPARYLFSKATDAVFGEVRGAIRQEVHDRSAAYFKEQGFGDEYADLLGHGTAFASDLVLASAGRQILDGARGVGQAAAVYANAPSNRTKGSTDDTRFINGVTVIDKKTGKALLGTVDLKPTLDRISSGKSFPHKNDGSVFVNKDRFLPPQSAGYYKEYVHPTPGVNGPGPQRIVTGQGGEIFYTPDHYKTFIRVNP